MVGASTFINPLLKIVTTIAILGAIYLFFVKPIIDTTNNAFEDFGLGSLSETFEGLPNNIQEQIDSALEGTTKSQATKLGNCVKRADSNTTKIQSCVDRFGG